MHNNPIQSETRLEEDKPASLMRIKQYHGLNRKNHQGGLKMISQQHGFKKINTHQGFYFYNGRLITCKIMARLLKVYNFKKYLNYDVRLEK